MPVHAHGTFFLARSRPETRRTADDQFVLTLHVKGEVNAHLREAYAAHWHGPAAEAFHQQHADQLQPGQPVALELTGLRSMHVGDRPAFISTYIAATVQACRLLPRSTDVARPAAPPLRAQPA